MKKVIMPLTEYKKDIQAEFTKGYNRALADALYRVIEAVKLRDAGDHRQANRAISEIFDDPNMGYSLCTALKIAVENLVESDLEFNEQDVPF